ncbi:hypothetical protein F5146DRAFT_1103186 [Armillaria mellea]|nr:hypothetical protein F5146DRAFT_1103186 [Armillaria mellea]
MVQSYLRHGPTQAFGLICSASSNSVYDGKLAYVPALEDVLVWDVKKGQMIAMWHETGHRAEVTCIIRSPRKNTFAVGYADGSIRLWDSGSSSVISTFNGHKKSVTALAFDEDGTRLASGSQDTDLIVWDNIQFMSSLRGHRDQITAIRFLKAADNLPSTSNASLSGFLLTISKDTFLKQVIAHRSDIWSMDLDANQNLIFTGSGEGELKAWKIDRDALLEGLKETESGDVSKMITPLSSLPLSSNHRVSGIAFHPSKPYLAVQSHDRAVEIFRIRAEEEVLKKQARRKKRAKEKKDKLGKEGKGDMNEDMEEKDVTLVDLFTPHVVVRASGKIRSFDFGGEDIAGKGVQLLLALASNAMEVYSIPPPVKSKDSPGEAVRLFSVDLPGHRTDIRSLSLSSDDQLLASASNGSLKIWNMKTNSCIRTMDCGHAICSTFLPGDRHVVAGTKNGEILIYDLASSSLIETINAHSGTVWSLHVRADGNAVVSGSADKDVKFWDIEDKSKEDQTRTLTLTHIRTLKMTDDVLSVRYSPNGKLLAVSLLDSTVKVFYQDSLKFFLSLYGHKLPVLSMDISHDSKLIVTCSADKNVKIWGLDFGDCHKSIFAHDESVMQVAFEHQSHYFWTVGKDSMLKYWDGDKFENIQKLEGHHREVWALALSHHGNFVVTGSHDKSIRVWEKLDEPLFLEEEREKELENMYENGIADSLNRNSGDDQTPNQAEATAVTKQTAETLMDGERIMEALTLADDERQIFEEYEDAMVEKVQSTSLQDALLVLPFGKVVSLMNYLNIWAQKEWNIVLVSRILFFLLRTHHHQIVANRVMRTALIPLRQHLRGALRRQKDTISYNLAALQYMRRRNDHDRNCLDEEKVRTRIAEGRKRKRVAIKA